MASAHTAGGGLDVPTIDISAFPTGTADSRAAVAKQVDEAARTVGFMQIIGHGIDPAVLSAFTAAMDAFFALDADIKEAYRRPPGVNRGYSPPKSESVARSLGLVSAADLFEAINIGSTTADYPGVPLPDVDYAHNEFPAEVPEFEPAVTGWFAEVGRVARMLTSIFAQALELDEDYFDSVTSHSIDVLRMINYRLPSADAELDPDQVGMGAHTDYGIVTLLWADQVPGLEILGADAVWYPVQPADGALLVNLGDALARWTNDRWISTMHRVAAPRIDGVLVPRRSAAFFHDGNFDAVIECLPSCVDAEHPALYSPVTIGEHLRAKLAGSRGGSLYADAREASRLVGA